MEPIIKIENLSKQYRLGDVGTGTLSHDLNRWWANVRGKEDPFLKIGETNTQNKKGDSDYVWALKDINLEVMPGEVLGIIGKNGAGKSTLLKLLSRVTAPTIGSIKARGRIASLLEVGTGFHPELTGRENIFLNGAILGMTKAEIRSKFDEIVDFAGVERYIDTPVKRYSSGMYVRLAFAVAAHLEPEILVVDEVLAVGDAEFQKKAIGKMQDVSKNDGRTVLFVSHNMVAIQNLCNSSILISNGIVEYTGKTEDVVDHYLHLQTLNKEQNISNVSGTGNKNTIIEKINLVNSIGKIKTIFSSNEKIFFEFFLKSNVNNLQNSSSFLDIGFNNNKDERVAWISSSIYGDKIDINKGKITFILKQFNLVPGEYNINYLLVVNGLTNEWKQNVCYFKIIDNDFYGTGRTLKNEQGYIMLNFKIQC